MSIRTVYLAPSAQLRLVLEITVAVLRRVAPSRRIFFCVRYDDRKSDCLSENAARVHSFFVRRTRARTTGTFQKIVRSNVTQPTAKLNAFPVFVRVEGRVVVIVGGGDEALAKARLLGQSSAAITIVAIDADAGARSPGSPTTGATHVGADYDAALLAGAVMVFAATGDEALDRRVSDDARALGIPVNAVDQPGALRFLHAGDRQPRAGLRGDRHRGCRPGAGADRCAPRSTSCCRRRWARWQRWPLRFATPPSGCCRKAGCAGASGTISSPARRRAPWRSAMPTRRCRPPPNCCAAQRAVEGHVALVGAGPGAEDLLTLRAQRHADGSRRHRPRRAGARGGRRHGPPRRRAAAASASARAAIPRARPRSTRCWSSSAREGKRVVRLKSGDPLVFGRAGEEMQALRDAGISYEVVPGVTAAFAAAADFELPLTLRGVSSSMVFTTGHDLQAARRCPTGRSWRSPAPPSPSIWAARSPPTSPRG